MELKEKSSADVALWFAEMLVDYCEELLAAVMSGDAADQNIERNSSYLFVGDSLAEG